MCRGGGGSSWSVAPVDDQRPFGSPRLTVIVSWHVVHRFATFQTVRMEYGVSRLLQSARQLDRGCREVVLGVQRPAASHGDSCGVDGREAPERQPAMARSAQRPPCDVNECGLTADIQLARCRGSGTATMACLLKR